MDVIDGENARKAMFYKEEGEDDLKVINVELDNENVSDKDKFLLESLRKIIIEESTIRMQKEERDNKYIIRDISLE
jgi:hypothetical protein